MHIVSALTVIISIYEKVRSLLCNSVTVIRDRGMLSLYILVHIMGSVYIELKTAKPHEKVCHCLFSLLSCFRTDLLAFKYKYGSLPQPTVSCHTLFKHTKRKKHKSHV